MHIKRLCKKCKKIEVVEELIVHLRETHGIGFDSFKRMYSWCEPDWDTVTILWKEHTNTGKVGIGMFKPYLKYNPEMDEYEKK
jgi:hypothetical protein